jgi:hypothetical protein
MSTYKSFFLNKILLLVLIAIGTLVGCDDDNVPGGIISLSNKADIPTGMDVSQGQSTDFEDSCLTFEEIEFSECPAVDVLEVCEPYFCEGCTSEFCVDFNFPEAFIGCQAIDCHTIDCDGVYDIQVDVYPSWTTIIDEEEVQITCQ